MRAVVDGRLYIGDAVAARDAGRLGAHRVRRTLCIGLRSPTPPEHRDGHSLEVSTALDEPHEQVFLWIASAIAALGAPVEGGGAILVHCAQGQSRSVATAALAAMLRTGFTVADAVAAVDGAGIGGLGGAGVNRGFACQLALAGAMAAHKRARSTDPRLPGTCRAHAHSSLLALAAGRVAAGLPAPGFAGAAAAAAGGATPEATPAAAAAAAEGSGAAMHGTAPAGMFCLAVERLALAVAAAEASGAADACRRRISGSLLDAGPAGGGDRAADPAAGPSAAGPGSRAHGARGSAGWGEWCCLRCGEALARDEDVALPLDRDGYVVPEAADTPVQVRAGSGAGDGGACGARGLRRAPQLSGVPLGSASAEQVAEADAAMVEAAGGLPTRAMDWMRKQHAGAEQSGSATRLACPRCSAKVGRAVWNSLSFPFVLSLGKLRRKEP